MNIFENKRDNDTLGGRIGRAREIVGLSPKEAALQLGVTADTWENWEGDREEPRANRLTMLAGFLNVSTAWLLHGIGEAPASGEFSEIVRELEERLLALEETHKRNAEAISAMKTIINRLTQAEVGE